MNSFKIFWFTDEVYWGLKNLVMKIIDKDGDWVTKTKKFKCAEVHFEIDQLKRDKAIGSFLDIVGGQKKI